MRHNPNVPIPKSPKKNPSPADREIATLNRGVRHEIEAALANLTDLSDQLGKNPLDTISSASSDQRESLLGLTDKTVSKVSELAAGIRMIVKIHALPPPTERPKVRNGFAGEVHLEEIEVEVVLTLDEKTGLIKNIQVLPPTDITTQGSKKRYQLRTVISGSELVKEILANSWSNNADDLRRLEKDLETTLLRSGTVTKNLSRYRVTKLTPGQLPSSRAWVNPDRDLRPKWEKKRKALGRERLKILSAP